MGYKELITSLHKEADRKTRSMWDSVEAESEKIRAEAREKSGRMKADFKERQANAVHEEEEIILKDVEKRSRIKRLSAERTLSDRLFLVAVSYLHEFRSERYKEIFASLVKELPSIKPECIRVHPEDVKIARAHFPDSNVESDSNIIGGLEVMRDNEKICIANTFEKRLERSWEAILPLLIRDSYKEIQRHGNSSTQ